MPLGPVVRKLLGPLEPRIADLYRSAFFEVGALAQARTHFKQDTILGPAHIPAHFLSLLIGGVIGAVTHEDFTYGDHAYNVLERGWIDVPNYN